MQQQQQQQNEMNSMSMKMNLSLPLHVGSRVFVSLNFHSQSTLKHLTSQPHHHSGSSSAISPSDTPSHPPHPHRNPYLKYSISGVHARPYEIVSSWSLGM